MDRTLKTAEPTTKIETFTTLEINIEELEPIVAPAIVKNHNETFVFDLEVEIEELEPIVAPVVSDPYGKIATNHNETFVQDLEIEVEELEPIIAPTIADGAVVRLSANHNETFVFVAII